MTEPRNEVAEVLGSPEYADAFRAVMSGAQPALLPDEQRQALFKAKELTRTPGAGYPMPLRLDPTDAAPVRVDGRPVDPTIVQGA